MRRRTKVLGSLLVVMATTVTVMGVTFSHDSTCPPLGTAAASAPTMNAYRYACYGSPEVLQLTSVSKPTPADSEVLVKVHAVSVNPLDWHYMRGKPYVMRMSSGIGAPTDNRIGADFAGTVESVGAAVTGFKVGDRVFGIADGAFAEYITIGERKTIAVMPDSVSFEQASAAGIAAITALQAVRDHGKVKAGQRVLINGASGGVGTFAVQIAKSYGAHVTGVASTRNVELVKSLGADRVMDYTAEDFTRDTARYDVIIDMVSNHPVRRVAAVLKPAGTCVIVGGTNDNRWIGPGIQSVRAILASPFVEPTFITMLADATAPDIRVVRDLMQAGKLIAPIDRRYPMAELPAAVAYLEKGRARGKVVVNLVP